MGKPTQQPASSAGKLEPHVHERAAIELLRAVRGTRSQVAFARRLGYRSNPITDWEHGRRHPTACEALRAAQLAGRPVREAFERFHPAPPPEQHEGQWQLQRWLRAVRAALPIVELANRVGRSRYTVGRWLAGQTQPKLHEFLHLVDALTGRIHDWVAELVPIAEVPSLHQAHHQAQTAKTLAFELPWTEALLRVLETTAYRSHPDASHQILAAWLGVAQEQLERALAGLLRAGIITEKGGRYTVVDTLNVDTRHAPLGMRQLQAHWLRLALERAEGGQEDWFAYNLISVSNQDLERIEEQLKRAYRETRNVVAASEPSESAALLLMQLVRFEQPKG